MTTDTNKKKRENGKRGSSWLTRERRLAIYIRDGFTCQYCGRDLKNAPAVELNLDHLVARNAGGGNESTNLITSCRSCNCSRQDKLYTEYATGGAIERIEVQRLAFVNIELSKAILSGTVGDPRCEDAR